MDFGLLCFYRFLFVYIEAKATKSLKKTTTVLTSYVQNYAPPTPQVQLGPSLVISDIVLRERTLR